MNHEPHDAHEAKDAKDSKDVKDPNAAQEATLRAQIAELEYPRVVNHADGTQTRVETAKEAEAALAKGATLIPTAPPPHDGGVPNHDHVVLLTAQGNPGLNPVRVERAVVLPADEPDTKKRK